MLKKNCFQLFQITGHFKCAGEFPAIINNKDDKKEVHDTQSNSHFPRDFIAFEFLV